MPTAILALWTSLSDSITAVLACLDIFLTSVTKLVSILYPTALLAPVKPNASPAAKESFSQDYAASSRAVFSPSSQGQRSLVSTATSPLPSKALPTPMASACAEKNTHSATASVWTSAGTASS
jgi:hypothetical protein